MILLRYPKKVVATQSLDFFDRCHSLSLAASATGSARERPRFDTSAYEIVIRFWRNIGIIAYRRAFCKSFLIKK